MPFKSLEFTSAVIILCHYIKAYSKDFKVHLNPSQVMHYTCANAGSPYYHIFSPPFFHFELGK